MTRERYCKTFVTVTALILFSLSGLPQVVAQGKDYSKFTINGGVGLSSPLGKGGDTLNTGYIVTVGGGYNFSKRLGVLAEYDYSHLGVEQSAADKLANKGTNDQVTANGRVWAFTGNSIMHLNRPGKVDFYGIAGAGVYQRRIGLSVTTTKSTGATTASFTKISTAFGINFGGGVTFEVGKGFKGYVEARYHHAFTEDAHTQLFPISVGIRW